MSSLLEFYGEECESCNAMKPLVERLEKQESVTLDKFETWHNVGNEKKRQEYDKGFCGGVPFFINTKNQKMICGAAPYEELRSWAKSE